MSQSVSMDFVDSTAFRLFFVVVIGGMAALALAIAPIVVVLLKRRASGEAP